MSQWEDLTPEDVVTKDELEEALEGIGGGPDTDELVDEIKDQIETVKSDDVERISRQSAADQVMHLIAEDCDTEACNQVREELPDELVSTGTDEGEDVNEGGGEEGESAETEGGSGEDDVEDRDEGVETNIFGEPV